MRPVISVIIPTLNEEDYLPPLLTDLSNQTNKDFEVIVVDAHSEDETKLRASKFKDSLNLRFFETPRNGVSFQRNFGATKAQTDFLFFLDADSLIKQDVIEKVIKHIQKDKKKLYIPLIAPDNRAFIYRFLIWISIYSVRSLQWAHIPMSLGPNVVIHKDLFEQIGGYTKEVVIAEDHNLVIKAYKHGVRAKFMTDVYCVFSVRRFEREGLFTLLWKYTNFTAVTLFRGGVTKTHHEYKMGGHHYKKSPATK